MSRLALQARGRPGVLDLFATLSAAAAGYACVGVACIAVARFGGFIAQIWLPNALTVLVLCAAPARYRFVIGAGAALGCVSANLAFNFALATSIALALANLLEIALAYRAVGLARGGIARRGPQRRVLAWALGALAAPALAALAGAAALHWTAGQSFAGSYRAWLVSDAFALAIVLPWTLRGATPQAAQEWTPRVLIEFCALLAASLAIGAASVRFLDWPFVAAALLPILTAARLPLAPQMALAGINALMLVVMVNFESMLAAPRVPGADPTTLTATSIAAFLPSIFIAFVFDSLRQQAQALAGEEARWRSVMQTSPIGMALVSLGGAFLEVNGALAQMLGYTQAELLTKTVHDLADPQDAQATLAAEAEVANGIYEVVRLQTRYRRKDAQPMTAIVALSALRRPDGTARVLLKQVEDITGRLEDARLLAQVRERERADARFRAAVEVAPAAMLIIDRRGDIAMVNAQVERAFGWRREELLGRTIEVLIPARLRTAHLAQRLAYLAAPQPRQMGEGRGLYALRKDGSEFPVEVGLAPFETGDRSFVLAALVDITQRKRGESDILRANADLEEFAYIVSHDLRTPLRAIDNLVDWISDDLGADPPGEVGRHLERLRLRVHRMENMIQDLFTYSRVGRTDVAREAIDPEALVQHLVEDLAIADAFPVEVRNSAGALLAARTPVATVLRNLLGNAVKHHDRAAGNVVVEVSRDGRFYVIAVTDDGPGIAAEDQGRIFKLFHTLAPVQGEHTGGIGLAVVKKWVEASGGNIQVTSPVEAGRGSSFTVRWPVDGEQVGTASEQG
ncbi:MAG TPA: PAS domain S-box protein [Burkholderiaceae bacterium]|nr:PAS domain S-box protein [Burkholderiaceae bacterium]